MRFFVDSDLGFGLNAAVSLAVIAVGAWIGVAHTAFGWLIAAGAAISLVSSWRLWLISRRARGPGRP